MTDFPAVCLASLAACAVCLNAPLLPSGPCPWAGGFRATDYRTKRLLSPCGLDAPVEVKLALWACCHACPQVRLADLLSIAERDPGQRTAALKRVACRSVDFAIIDRTGPAVLVIELDGRSHARPDRRVRDQQVEAALERGQISPVRSRPGQRAEAGGHLARAQQQAAA